MVQNNDNSQVAPKQRPEKSEHNLNHKWRGQIFPSWMSDTWTLERVTTLGYVDQKSTSPSVPPFLSPTPFFGRALAIYACPTLFLRTQMGIVCPYIHEIAFLTNGQLKSSSESSPKFLILQFKVVLERTKFRLLSYNWLKSLVLTRSSDIVHCSHKLHWLIMAWLLIIRRGWNQELCYLFSLCSDIYTRVKRSVHLTVSPTPNKATISS